MKLLNASIESHSDSPDQSWSLDKLKTCILENRDAIRSFRRKMAIHTHRLGCALSVAYQKLPRGKWAKFLKHVRISVATDNRARKIAKFFADEAELNGMTVTQAYRKAGIPLGKPEPEIELDKGENDDGEESAASKPEPERELHEGENDESDLNEDGEKSAAKNSKTKRQSKKRPAAPELKEDTEPKEDPGSFGLRLAQLVERAAWLAEVAPAQSPTQSEVDHWRDLVGEVRDYLVVVEGAINAGA